MTDTPLKYRRVLLKLSGEALMGREDYGIDPEVIRGMARDIIQAQQAGAQIGLRAFSNNLGSPAAILARLARLSDPSAIALAGWLVW